MSQLTIDSSKVHGEPGTGYEGPQKGPFECGNCEYFRKADSSCGQETMMKVSKLARTKDGRVKVDEHGCCEYVERVGKKLRKVARNWMKRGKADAE